MRELDLYQPLLKPLAELRDSSKEREQRVLVYNMSVERPIIVCEVMYF
jgi:hypothetical protein